MKNIVKCNDAIYWESKLWILIEYCEGGALGTGVFTMKNTFSGENMCRVSKKYKNQSIHLEKRFDN